MPFGGFILSLVLVFILPDQALTGRGYIFDIVRRGWEEAPLLGPGRGALLEAYEPSASIWLSPHEHSQAAYVLAEGGGLGLVVFAVALLGIAAACWRTKGPLPAIFAFVPALGFLIEPIWEFSLQSLCFVSLLLTAALQRQSQRAGPLPVPETAEVASV